ncbi:cytochrome P450 2K1-like [Gastrophryne carolinensis]
MKVELSERCWRHEYDLYLDMLPNDAMKAAHKLLGVVPNHSLYPLKEMLPFTVGKVRTKIRSQNSEFTMKTSEHNKIQMERVFNSFPFLGFLPGSHKKIIRNINEFHEFTVKTFLKSLENLDENDQRSFVETYLVKQKEEAGDPNTYFHKENLKGLIRNLFSAGMETTSTTLRWAMLLMMTYPDIQEKVQEEISRVIGSAQPLYNHRTQMPYTNAVIHEVQRFADIVPLNISHETTKDVKFRGFFLPKGTTIIPLLSSVLWDKTQFETPEKFNPNHFLDAKGNFVKKDAFIPFSIGRRVCVGETLARMELFIFFTSLLQKFTIRYPPGVTTSDLTPASGYTNIPKQTTVCMVPRG